MQNKINKLNELYKDEIDDILGNLPFSKSNKNKTVDFAGFLNEEFNITDCKEYEEYIDIVNEFEEYDPVLVSKLEKYLSKEMNLIALLALHTAHTKQEN